MMGRVIYQAMLGAAISVGSILIQRTDKSLSRLSPACLMAMLGQRISAGFISKMVAAVIIKSRPCLLIPVRGSRCQKPLHR